LPATTDIFLYSAILALYNELIAAIPKSILPARYPMSKLVKVNLNGREVWMEASDQNAERAPTQVSVQDAGQTSLEVSKNLHETIIAHFESVTKSFQSLSAALKPEKVTVEFGLKLSGDLKFYIVNAKADASVTIKADWAPKNEDH
jgi:hypothetical protein